MKITTLFFCSLFFVSANAQTKEAEFKKTEAILKKSNGLQTTEFKIVDYTFTEKGLKMDAVSNGKNFSVLATPDWASFSYYIKKVKDNEKLSNVVFSFDDEFSMTVFENKKQVDKMKEEEMQIFINTADTKELEEQLDELKSYTDKSLNSLRTADQSTLIRYISKNLNAAAEEDGGKIKSVNECEITFDYGDEIITVPVKRLNIHSKGLVSSEHLLCFGKQGAPVKTTKATGATTTKTVEHPEIELFYEGPDDDVTPVKFAIRRLATFCSR